MKGVKDQKCYLGIFQIHSLLQFILCSFCVYLLHIPNCYWQSKSTMQVLTLNTCKCSYIVLFFPCVPLNVNDMKKASNKYIGGS